MDREVLFYHGTVFQFDTIDLSHCARFKDFGIGFYVTSYKEQAIKWATLKKGRKCSENGYVYTYKLSLEQFNGLNRLELLEYSKDWLDIIVENRFGNSSKSDDYDVIYDRMADNRCPVIRDSISKYRMGKIPAEKVLQLLSFQQTADQYCFKTQKAIQSLTCVQQDII